ALAQTFSLLAPPERSGFGRGGGARRSPELGARTRSEPARPERTASEEPPDTKSPALPRDRPQAEALAAAALAAGVLQTRDAAVPQSSSPAQWSSLEFLAQVRQTYLICEGPDGICVLDQHAAAERVLFAKLRAQYQAR